jgi:hypothetical protein
MLYTIDDLQFPPTNAPAVEVELAWDVKLPGKPVLPAGTKVLLSHTGVFAVVEVNGEVWKF